MPPAAPAPGASAPPALPPADQLLNLGLRLALTLAVAFLFQRLLYLAVARFEKLVVRSNERGEHAAQRAHTVGQILRGVVTVVVAGGAVIHALGLFGWDVKPLLAGAGVLGIALGFGAQTLVRDTISGLFILAEDQFSVGDLIEVGGKPATVEAMSLRHTRLRDFNGFVHFVPNGEMKIVVNRSRGWQRVAVDVPVAADQDVEPALEVCRRAADGMNMDPVWRARLMDPIELWGIESLTATEAVLRLVLRARPGPDAPEASRALRQRVHKALSEAGIRFGPSRELTLAGEGGTASRRETAGSEGNAWRSASTTP